MQITIVYLLVILLEIIIVEITWIIVIVIVLWIEVIIILDVRVVGVVIIVEVLRLVLSSWLFLVHKLNIWKIVLLVLVVKNILIIWHVRGLHIGLV